MSNCSSESSEENNEVSMWTLVKKLDEDEYDCIPNEWLISTDQCYYPPEGESVASLKKLAKLGTSPNHDWSVKTITIIKRDFENFDRCVMDACRMQKNRRTVTSSENEIKDKRASKLNSKYQDSPQKEINFYVI